MLIVLATLQLAYATALPLHGDEAYYWVWSQHPALSYFDHPPMIAWLLALSTWVGASTLSIRLVPVTCLALAAWLTSRLAGRVYGERAAALALLVFLALPITQMGALLATPDAPLTLFWTLALYATYRAVFDGGSGWFLLAGSSIGLALSSKYTAILLPGALLLFLLLRRRAVLLDPRAWLAMTVALLAFAPVLLWNRQHGWISFAFQYAHGSSSAPTLHAATWFEFVAGILLAYSPILLVIALIAALSRPTWRDDRRLFLACFFLLPLAFFLYKGLFKKMELNWVAIAFPAATVLLAGHLAEHRWGRSASLGLALAVCLSLLVKFPAALGLPEAWSIQQRLAGYREASLELLKLRRPGEALYADHLTTASLLSYYAPGHPDVRIPTATRFSQYDLWGQGMSANPPSGLYLAKGARRDAELAQYFAQVELLEVMPVRGLRTFYLYRCQGRPS